MRFVKQLFRHDPANGVYGDCYRTVVACLLDLDHEQVPHRHEVLSNEEQCGAMDAFLRDRGVQTIRIALNGGDVDGALAVAVTLSDGLPYLFSGQSRNGTNHVVIARDDRIIHDPSLDDSGIVGPTDVGQFWVEWLVLPLKGYPA
ncbi:MAG: hypothetical protein EOR85_12885 [Mesorhizobium sp.]|uniref:hypothetical protein n=1 Tax=Mesorhizobium sp. TaxID=1871066 RepID=UPI000FE66FD2|nr:hypothetical protein [Mesorhizobium sp.]RWK61816.1 MAG: hypothetical protein EOR49_16150 [Mesorhizobium sp.]RWM47665.1 MAG: hypothetical protein EOR76_14210 [Mesorhizobium sp.]RWN02397.1 MAG: hypothetical protein EOR85_12885 [Mesorhizobium sp.]